MAQTILITGGNGDFGRCLIDLALEAGKTVFTTIRNEAQLSTFPDHKNLSVLMMDVSDRESVRAGFSELDRALSGRPLDAIIHAAAIIEPSTIEFLKPETLERIFKTNTVGSLNIMQETFPRLRSSNGNLVLCSSIYGRVSGPTLGAYAISKFGLEAMVDAARRETRGMGFSITSINIGANKGTSMLDGNKENTQALADQTSEEEKLLYGKVYSDMLVSLKRLDPLFYRVERSSREILRITDMSNPRPRYRVGSDTKLMCFLSWLLPVAWFDAL